ncbi:MAG: threonine synthase [Clostridia bacterium]|nr:threonine synthase [Clostridia bacterium]
MFYISTRNEKIVKTPAEAILMGIAEDGGLYVPESFESAVFPMEKLRDMNENEISATVLSLLFSGGSMFGGELSDFSAAVSRAYNGKFENGDYAPVAKVGNAFVMELYHGPTCAFKDVALQLLPHLISEAKRSVGMTDDIVILTATSGDTGSAALSGFADIPGIKIVVFYPKEGTSAVQERQMVSCAGKNTCVCAVYGNFDDAQSGVKNIFASLKLPDGVKLSSANSINIGRLAPQVAYYFKSYRDLINNEEIEFGDKLNFVVPTGNFGDILAGYFAKMMGLPIAKLICASNRNNVLTDFFEKGLYDRNREFHITTSPSMDILISSNLERLLYFMCGSEKCAKYMSELRETGKYQLEPDELAKIREFFDAGFADDEETFATINSVYKKHGYLMDTHTAVAWNVYEKWLKENDNGCKSVVLSTASAYKFSSGVLHSLGLECPNEFDAIDVLAKRTGIRPPRVIADIRNKKILHTNVVKKEDMMQLVENIVRTDKVIVRVPATSANLGSGFDCTGIAFRRYNVFSFEKIESGFEFEGFPDAFANEGNLAYVSYKRVCERVGASSNVRITSIRADVPIARGLGSSAALIVAGAYAANILTGNTLSIQEVFEICNNIEGHPDNIAPALFGGLCTSIVKDGVPIAQKYSVSDKLFFTALIPDFKVDTKKARAALPTVVSREDAIFNMQRIALLPYTFEHGRLDLIRLVTDDRLHQSYRRRLFKNIDEIENAAYECGALSFAVSGAGPTCLAFSEAPIYENLNEKIKMLENNWIAYGVSVDNEGAKQIYDEQ